MRKSSSKLDFTKNCQTSWFSCRHLKISKCFLSLAQLGEFSKSKVTSLCYMRMYVIFILDFTKNCRASWFSCRHLKISKCFLSLAWLGEFSKSKVTPLCYMRMYVIFIFYYKIMKKTLHVCTIIGSSGRDYVLIILFQHYDSKVRFFEGNR